MSDVGNGIMAFGCLLMLIPIVGVLIFLFISLVIGLLS